MRRDCTLRRVGLVGCAGVLLWCDRAVGQSSVPSGVAVRIVRHDESPAVRDYRLTLSEIPPPLVGFRVPLLESASQPWPFDWPARGAAPGVVEAARWVEGHLASDGLLVTLAEVIRRLSPQRVMAEGGIELLKQTGLPVDLSAYFEIGDARSGDAIAVVRAVANLVWQETSPAETSAKLAAASFGWRPTVGGFQLASEGGEHDIGTIRLQLPSAKDYLGEGDGGAVDVFRQLAREVPDARLLVFVEAVQLQEVRALAEGLAVERRAEVVVLPLAWPVSQWAQDNGKVGMAAAPDGMGMEVVTLVPRIASRGEEGTTFVPGDSFLADALAAAGERVEQSPLLFQGGNLICVGDPVTGERLLFVGEAEVYRNMALGLTEPQVIEAFRVEFGVDRCIILPAVSYHIDYEVTFRTAEGRRLAFVNDTTAAVKTILAAGLQPLQSAGVLEASAVARAEAELRSGRFREFLSIVLSPMLGRAERLGGYPSSLAEHFRFGPADSDVGNLQQFLLALDLAAAEHLTAAEWPQDEHAQAYRRAARRGEARRQALHRTLEGLGWQLAPIPSLAAEARSLNYLNGVQAPDRYFMPVHGGLYADLDRLATRAFAAGLGGGARIVAIRTSESQRRDGALRCSVAWSAASVSR